MEDPLIALDAAGRHVTYQPGEALMHQGDRGDSIVRLLAGMVRVTTVTADGRRLLLALRGPGAVLGELAAIDGQPRSASVTAVELVRAVVVPITGLRAVLGADPDVGLRIMGVLTSRLRESDDRFVDAVTSGLVGRLTRRLLEVAAMDEVATVQRSEAAMAVLLRVSQQDLADWLGVSRERVNTALGDLRDAGIIQTGRMRVVIRDLDALRQRAAGIP